ncbi:MAG: hypothetical protein AAB436_01770 [Patescibacteria group bacterium]
MKQNRYLSPSPESLAGRTIGLTKGVLSAINISKQERKTRQREQRIVEVGTKSSVLQEGTFRRLGSERFQVKHVAVAEQDDRPAVKYTEIKHGATDIFGFDTLTTTKILRDPATEDVVHLHQTYGTKLHEPLVRQFDVANNSGEQGAIDGVLLEVYKAQSAAAAENAVVLSVA